MTAAKSTKKTPAKPRSKKTTTAPSAETTTKAAPTGAKTATANREARPKEEGLVVFAIRLSEPERDAIHEAAGPARATKFIRAVAIAAAHGDVDAFKRALKDAEEARGKAAKK